MNLSYQLANQKKVYQKAKAIKLTKIEGTLVAKDFLTAISKQIALV